jgi:hypothetical protein
MAPTITFSLITSLRYRFSLRFSNAILSNPNSPHFRGVLQKGKDFELTLNDNIEGIISIPISNHLIVGFKTAEFGVLNKSIPFSVVPLVQKKQAFLFLGFRLIWVIEK